MRTKSSIGIVSVVAMLACAGCQSGINMPKFAWGKKNNQPSNTALTNAPAAPALPSTAAATPTGSNSFGYAGANPATTAGGATQYPDQPAAAASPYPTTNYPAQPADYTSSQPAGATPYGQPAVGGAPASPAGGNMAAQSGPYNPVYGQGAGGAAAANPYSNVPYTPPATGANQYNVSVPAQQDPASSGYGASAGSYGAPSAGAGGYGAPSTGAGAYGAPATNPGGYGAPSATAAGSYGAPAQSPSGYNAPAGSPQAYSPPPPADPNVAGGYIGGSTRPAYQPGESSYQPGTTPNGYNPPNTPGYQNPAQNNANPGSYRPGGTSDYVPTSSRGTPASPAAASTGVTPANYTAPAYGASAAGTTTP